MKSPRSMLSLCRASSFPETQNVVPITNPFTEEFVKIWPPEIVQVPESLTGAGLLTIAHVQSLNPAHRTVTAVDELTAWVSPLMSRMRL